MPEFTDCKGRTWKLNLTVADLPGVRSLCGVGAAEPLTTDRIITGMYGSGPAELTAFVWGLCGEQAKAVGVTERDFAGGLDATALDGMFDAVEAMAVSFFNRSAAGVSLRRTLPKIRDHIAKKAEAAILRQIERDEPPTSNASAGTSPASSESTPVP